MYIKLRFFEPRRLLASCVLAFFIATVFPPGIVPARAARGVAWDGASVDVPRQTGVAGEYEIGTPEQLAGLRAWVKSGTNANATYRLTADIDLGGHEWEPIGIAIYDNIGEPANGTPFRGKFDGNGHTVHSFKIASSDYGHEVAGLFGFVKPADANTYAIQNLTVRDVEIDLKIRRNAVFNVIAAGGLIGYLENTARIEGCSVSNVMVSVDVQAGNPADFAYCGAYAGGVVGFADGGLIVRGTTASGIIQTNAGAPEAAPTSVLSMAGGVVGFAGPGLSVTDSDASAQVGAKGAGNLHSSPYTHAGGIAGGIGRPVPTTTGGDAGYLLKNVHSSGSIFSTGIAGGLVGLAGSAPREGLIEHSVSDADVAIFGESDPMTSIAGGLVGMNECEIFASAAFGDVSGGLAVGGLVGHNAVAIRQSYSTGRVTAGNAGADAEARVGGLVGENFGTIEDCYARGDVHSSNAAGANRIFAGGLVGTSWIFDAASGIDRTYAYGNVSGGNAQQFVTGGLIGKRERPDELLHSAWRKTNDGSVNLGLDDATGLNSLGNPGDSDYGTAEEISRHASSMDVMSPETEAVFSATKGWHISSADVAPSSYVWTWSPLDGSAAPVLRVFFADDARTKLGNGLVSLSPRVVDIGPGQTRFVTLQALGFPPEDIRVSPATLGGVAIEPTSDGRIVLRAPEQTSAASHSVRVSYKINGYEQAEETFSLSVRAEGAAAPSPGTPSFHDVPGEQTWINAVPIPNVAFSVTQPEPLLVMHTLSAGAPHGVNLWTRPIYTPMGDMERLDIVFSGKPTVSGRGTIDIEAFVYSLSSGAASATATATASFPYTVLDNGSPTISGMPSSVQTWERGVPVAPLGDILIERTSGGNIHSVLVAGLPPGVSASLQPDPATLSGGAERVAISISGTPAATISNGNVTVEAIAGNGAVETKMTSYRMVDKGAPSFRSIPGARQDWKMGAEISPLQITVTPNTDAITDIEVSGLPDGLRAVSGDTSTAGRMYLTISGTPTKREAGTIEILAHTEREASCARFDYTVAPDGEPFFTRVPTEVQQWTGGEQIVPVAVRVQGKNNHRILRTEVSGMPEGLQMMRSDVSSTDIWFSFIGSPSLEGEGSIAFFVEAENNASATVSFDYVVGVGAPVTSDDEPIFTGVPPQTQQWTKGREIVPVTVRVQGGNDRKLARVETSGLPAGLNVTRDDVSSRDVRLSFTGTPTLEGEGSVGIFAETENGAFATTGFDYIVKSSDAIVSEDAVPIGDIVEEVNNAVGGSSPEGGNVITPITELPPGLELGLGENGGPTPPGEGHPITHIPPGNAVFTPQPSPNPDGSTPGPGGTTNPPGVLLPDYSNAGDSISITIDLGNGTSGDVFAMEYEMNLLGHPYFRNWRTLSEAARVALLAEVDARLVYEYAKNAVTRTSPAFLVGTDGILSWPNALADGVIRLTDVGFVVRYIVTDRDMNPFESGGFLVIPDGNRDNYLIDPLWLLVRDSAMDHLRGSSGCDVGAWGLGLLSGAILRTVLRRKK